MYENEYKPFKITFKMSSVFETPKTEISGEIEYEYVAWNIKVVFFIFISTILILDPK